MIVVVEQQVMRKCRTRGRHLEAVVVMVAIPDVRRSRRLEVVAVLHLDDVILARICNICLMAAWMAVYLSSY